MRTTAKLTCLIVNIVSFATVAVFATHAYGLWGLLALPILLVICLANFIDGLTRIV